MQKKGKYSFEESRSASIEPADLEDGVPERGQWGHPAEFILSSLGCAVGLGNVWRFPYLCYINGGGAFLIPYTIMLTFVGIPIFLIELTLGQYSSSGPMTVWSISPIFQGVGVGIFCISCISNIYYNQIIAWSIYYLYKSWSSTLPWDGCDHDFNTPNCYSHVEAGPCKELNGTWFNRTCYNDTMIGARDEPAQQCDNTGSCVNVVVNPLRDLINASADNQPSPSEEYFNWAMLRRSERIEDTGALQWDLVLVLIVAWVICFLCILKGIRSSGKVVYFTATFPYLLLTVLFFRGVTLDGAGEGIKFFIIPEWEKIGNAKVWVDAAGQIFFSIGVGFGSMMTFASYNKFTNNVYRDTLIVTIGNCLTSLFAGFVIFSILGYMAKQQGVEVSEVASSGSGLAFIAYPEVVLMLPVPQLWATLFFFMLLTLGLDSQFGGLENIQTAICDLFPSIRPYKALFAFGMCSFFFLLGLPMCTNAGIYWLELMSYYSGGWSLVVIGLLELIVFAWVYGADKIRDNIEEMCGVRLHIHWIICWKYVAPLILIVVIIFNFIYFTPLSYGDYELPGWAQTLGWLMAALSVVMVLLVAVLKVARTYREPGWDNESLWRRIYILTKPTSEWGPVHLKKKPLTTMRPLEEKPPQYAEATSTSHSNPAFDSNISDHI